MYNLLFCFLFGPQLINNLVELYSQFAVRELILWMMVIKGLHVETVLYGLVEYHAKIELAARIYNFKVSRLYFIICTYSMQDGRKSNIAYLISHYF